MDERPDDPTPQPWDDEARMLAAHADVPRLLALLTPQARTPDIAERAVGFATLLAKDCPARTLDGLRGWLFVVAEREVWRLNRRAIDVARAEAAYEAGAVAPEPHPDAVCRRAVARQVADVLDRLPGIGPKALMWQAEGLTLREIAAVLGRSVKDVDNAMRRTREKVRESVELGVVPLLASARRLRFRHAVPAAVPVLGLAAVLLPAVVRPVEPTAPPATVRHVEARRVLPRTPPPAPVLAAQASSVAPPRPARAAPANATATATPTLTRRPSESPLDSAEDAPLLDQPPCLTVPVPALDPLACPSPTPTPTP